MVYPKGQAVHAPLQVGDWLQVLEAEFKLYPAIQVRHLDGLLLLQVAHGNIQLTLQLPAGFKKNPVTQFRQPAELQVLQLVVHWIQVPALR